MPDNTMQTEMMQEIFSDLIDLPEKQMRRDIDRDELHVLAESIKEKGLIAPITVRSKGERYELVAGQRRLLACRIAGIIRIPCIVRILDDASALDIMATENLERRDVDVLDEANFISLVMKETNANIAQMAERLHRSVQYVRDRITVGDMPEYMQAHLKSGALKLGVALALIKITPDEKRRVWIGLAVEKNITIREADYWAYQHELGTLPEVRPLDSDMPDAPANEYRPLLVKCALDGKEYPMSETDLITVYKGNIAIIKEVARQIASEPVAS